MTAEPPHFPYLDDILHCLTSAEQPDWQMEEDQVEVDGETVVGVVLSWTKSSALNTEQWPDGVIVCWNEREGWQYAASRPDGGNEHPDDLIWETVPEPVAVAAAIRQLLTDGPESLPVKDAPRWAGADEMMANLENYG